MPTSFTVDAIRNVLALEPVGEDRYRATSLDLGHNVVFGGQLLAQSIAAASLGQEGKTAKTLHTVFARAARPDQPLDVAVTRLHSGRAVASSTVTLSQGDKVCVQSTVLLSADEDDLIRHADNRSDLPIPPAEGSGSPAEGSGSPAEGSVLARGDWEVQIIGGIDLSDPDGVGPPEVDVWTRFAGAPDDDRVLGQELLAFATDGFLIGTAMRPHKGVGQAQSHKTLSTGVLSHTITFHEPIHAGKWHLLSHRSSHAGSGRSYGRAEVFTADGALVASFVQDAMIRAMPDRKTAL